MPDASVTEAEFVSVLFPRPLVFTPAEWRKLLDSPAFLKHQGNSYSAPRRLMGLPVKIVPDHQTVC